MKKYLPSILSLLVMATGLLSPMAQDYVAHHATLSIVLASLSTILGHMLPSPLK